jgi:hypothetical protein
MVSTAPYRSASTRLSLAPFVAGIICLIVAHVATVFLLYGSRAFVRSFAVPPELVVFLSQQSARSPDIISCYERERFA